MSASYPSAASGTDFYRRVLDVLEAESVEFLVGGAFALNSLAGIERDTKDFDLMLRPRDVERALRVCRAAGFRADYAFSHWIAKIHFGEHFIDLIYRAGNGLCEVDDLWFAHAPEATVLGRMLRICPPEEVIWQKAFIMERERFDGGDILHVLHRQASTLDWARLLDRFGQDWRVLLSHLTLFGFVYPSLRGTIPAQVLNDLLDRMRHEGSFPSDDEPLCQGTLLSRAQYLPDIERWGYRDARTEPRVAMTEQEIVTWTNAIDGLNRAH